MYNSVSHYYEDILDNSSEDDPFILVRKSLCKIYRELFKTNVKEKTIIQEIDSIHKTMNSKNRFKYKQILSEFWKSFLILVNCRDPKLLNLKIYEYFLQASFQENEELLEMVHLVCHKIPYLQHNFYQGIKIEELFFNFFKKKIQESLDDLDYSISNEKMLYLKKTLNYLKQLSEKLEESQHLNFKEGLMNFKLRKKKFAGLLPNSVIIGVNGGIFMLLNTVDEEERNILFATADPIRKKFYEKLLLDKEEKKTKKIIVGKGGFGEVRLAIVLCENINSLHSEINMKIGDIVCIKKVINPPSSLNKDMANFQNLFNVLREYHINMGFSFTPEVYDFSLTTLDTGGFKGYVVLKLLPFEQIKKTESFSRIYLFIVDLFRNLNILFENGYCPMDLKIENTLFDKENSKCKIIDFGGAVFENNRNDLENSKADGFDITTGYVAPEIRKRSSSTMNLPKALAYSCGVVLEKLTLEAAPNLPIDQKEKLNEIISNLKKEDFKERLSISGALKELESYFDGKIEITKAVDQQKMQQVIELNFKSKRFKKFADEALLPLMAVNNMIDRNDQKEELLNNSFENFLRLENNYIKVFLVTGKSGAGKTTFLKERFIKVLKDWEYGKPFPILFDLVKSKNFEFNFALQFEKGFKKNIEKQMNHQKLDFPITIFTKDEYPLILFFDSFEKARITGNIFDLYINQISKNIKFVVSCNEDYINTQNKEEMEELFQKSGFSYMHYHIADLNFEKEENTENIENLQKYIVKQNRKEKEVKKLFDTIYNNNIAKLLKTAFEVKIMATIIPNLDEKVKNTEIFHRTLLFKEYIKQILSENEKKISPSKMTEILNFFDKKTSFFDCATSFLIEKAKQSHLNTKLKKYEIPGVIGKNHPFYIFKRALKSIVNIEILEKNKEYRFTVEFTHDLIKNYFIIESFDLEMKKLTKSVISEFIDILKEDDESFLKEFIDNMHYERNSRKFNILKFFITRSTKNELGKNDYLASSKAFTILSRSQIPLLNENFRSIKIPNADMSLGIFSGCDFSFADLTGVNMTNCKIENCIFVGTIMNDIILGDDINEINFTSPIMSFCLFQTFHQDDIKIETVVVSCENSDFYFVKIKEQKKKISFDIYKLNIPSLLSPEEIDCFNFNRNLSQLFLGFKSSNLTYNKLSIEVFDIKSPKKEEEINKGEKKESPIMSNNIDDFFALRLLSNIFDECQEKFRLHSLIFSHDGNFLIELRKEFYFRVWVKKNNKYCVAKLHKFINDNNEEIGFSAIIFAHNDSFLLLGTEKNTLYLNNAPFDKESIILNYSPSKIYFPSAIKVIASLEKELKFLSGCKNGEIILFEINCDKETENKSCFVLSKTNFDNEITALAFINKMAFLCGDVKGRITLCAIKYLYAGDQAIFDVLKFFDWHSKKITSLSLVYSNRRFISSSLDKKLRIWKLPDLEQIKNLERHKINNPIANISISSIEKFILSVGGDGKCLLWSGLTLNLLAKFSLIDTEITSACISFDDEYIIIGGKDGSIFKMERKTERKYLQFQKIHKDSITGISFHRRSFHNQYFLISSSLDKSICIWDYDLCELISQYHFNNKIYFFDYFSFNLEDRIILVGDQGKIIIKKLFPIGNNKEVKEIENNEIINAIKYYPFDLDATTQEKKLFLTAAKDFSLKVWDVFNADKPLKIINTESEITSMDFSDDGAFLITGDTYKYIKIWEYKKLDNFSEIQRIDAYSFIYSVKITKSKIIAGCNDGTIKLWENISNYKKNYTVHEYFHQKSVNKVVFSHDGKNFFTGGDDGKVISWEAETGKSLSQIEKISSVGGCVEITSLCLSHDSKFLIFGDSEGKITSYSTNDFSNMLFEREAHTITISALCLSKDNKILLSASFDSTINVYKYDFKTIELEKTYESVNSFISVNFLPGDKEFIAFNFEGDLILCDVSKISQKKIFAHENINGVCFTKDKKYFLTFSDDELKLWPSADIKPSADINGKYLNLYKIKKVKCVEFLESGKYFICGIDQSICILETFKGSKTYEFKIMHENPIIALAISPVNKCIVSTGVKEVKIWKWDKKLAEKAEEEPSYPELLDLTVHTLKNFNINQKNWQLSGVIPLFHDHLYLKGMEINTKEISESHLNFLKMKI